MNFAEIYLSTYCPEKNNHKTKALHLKPSWASYCSPDFDPMYQPSSSDFKYEMPEKAAQEVQRFRLAHPGGIGGLFPLCKRADVKQQHEWVEKTGKPATVWLQMDLASPISTGSIYVMNYSKLSGIFSG